MYSRTISSELLEISKQYPIVTVIGPRQAGKTTLVKSVFPDKPYFNMEKPDLRQSVLEDPNGFLENCSDGAIIDEVQNVPELLSYLQVLVDEKAKNGLFILTGSHQLDLHQKITQSLAGRTALLSLLPLSLYELEQSNVSLDSNTLLFKGFMPRIYHQKQNPTKAYRNYLQTYIERDVRNMINLKDLSTFQRFMIACASRIGQLVNYEELSRDLGVSNNTIKHWLSVLEASFVIVRLQPYFANINKRLIKTPKLYFVEPGLACYLLGIESEKQLARDPLRGQLFENMVVIELMKARLNKGLSPNMFFYRDQQGHEVDILYKQGGQFIAAEIKASQTFNAQFLKQLKYLKNLLSEQIEKSYVIYAGEHTQKIQEIELINFLKTYMLVEY